MKIGVEATTLSGRFTGTNRYITCLIEQLENTPHNIIKFAPNYGKWDKNRIAKTINRNWYRNFGLKKDRNFSKADCFIFPDYYMPHNTGKRSAIIIHDLSFISHPHLYSQKFVRYYSYQIKQTLNQNPVIATISEHSAKNINKYLGEDESDIYILQAYSKLASIESSKKQNNKISEQPYLLFVGHLEPRKNLNFLIEGFLKWKNSGKNNYKLKIVGELWIKSPAMISLLKKYRNNTDVEFTGYVTETQLYEIYSGASGFVHTSFEEGFGFPVLEAMHFGLPVLCSRNIATEEISKPDSISIDPSNTESYLEGLDKLENLIHEKKQINYHIKYTPGLMSNQLGELLEKLTTLVRKYHRIKIPSAETPEQAIEKTLVYSNLFNSGIRSDNIHKQIFDKSLSPNELQRLIEKLTSMDLISHDDGMLKLKNFEEGFYVRDKNKIENKKLRRIIDFLLVLPFVSLISFSGGSTHYGLENHEDIDLFIITKPNTIYIVYFLIHIYSVLFKVRNILCVNYLLDERNILIDHSHDPYTAHQVISLTALKNEKMLNHFWKANDWVKEYFPNFEYSENEIKKSSKFYAVFKPFNNILMLFYKTLYRDKLKLLQKDDSMKLTNQCIKLHTNDYRDRIMNEFKAAWEQYSRSYKLT